MSLRVLFFEKPGNPYFNLALEEALARACSVARECFILRIWRNMRAVVIGYFRNVSDEVNVSIAKSKNIPIVRRFTGGGAVYHDMGNLNYTLVIKNAGIRRDVSQVYTYILNGILVALRNLGLKPEIRNVNDVVVNGWKVSGTAASLRWNTMFLHGSLLINSDLKTLYEVLIVPPRKQPYKNVDPVKYRVNNLSTIVGRRVSFWEIANLIIDGFSETLGLEPVFDKPTSLEVELAEKLYIGRYMSPQWNLQKKSISEFKFLEEEICEILSKNKKL